MNLLNQVTNIRKSIDLVSSMSPLLFRLILAPVLIIAGYSKLGLSADTASFMEAITALPEVINWFGNEQWGLGLPFPALLAFLAGWTEFLGGWLLLIGLLTRLVAVPLAFTMLVAMFTVHIDNGWFAITPTSTDTSPAKVFEWLSMPLAKASLENSEKASQRLTRMRDILAEHGHTDYLYETGKPVILNNGIEFGFIYFAMLLSLLSTGGGRYTSTDYWLWKKFKPIL
jgi:uncharacterized membrane protein YphA (DoxX/SURF4 family)